MMEKPKWAAELNPSGQYYEGYVESLQGCLDLHSSSTVTTYGVTPILMPFLLLQTRRYVR